MSMILNMTQIKLTNANNLSVLSDKCNFNYNELFCSDYLSLVLTVRELLLLLLTDILISVHALGLVCCFQLIFSVHVSVLRLYCLS